MLAKAVQSEKCCGCHTRTHTRHTHTHTVNDLMQSSQDRRAPFRLVMMPFAIRLRWIVRLLPGRAFTLTVSLQRKCARL